jgi:hypothetical protein
MYSIGEIPDILDSSLDNTEVDTHRKKIRTDKLNNTRRNARKHLKVHQTSSKGKTIQERDSGNVTF